ncbi:N-acetylmuramoyl-L-alanine amidase [Psychroserpens sp.]|uniref:N-acetylmuramoyl-L-alanine amidase n=1 Tax=Psychroserpens sp. TaxID=2020870 RepID=UPI001B072440|nr:N-acetylmuramoyl-L-alanine amidase [Psychroserpens sp.]MBO6607568.1 N-acetylmuramoyl-L-alanine amidase [Psychroserpens sp.]MBO6655228.1 N-acetylmuramoyl-L-alanine amidase [Psychroserpens sp.]MBO6683182.1 N-acetylmuramoyl-L-alanine amidase [Psychroserpens sp.]MBO6749746.1 N-acetylmuramoyl-L-alanine amidase [Psychroserpens sp.]MBO6916670.1 N-acetylmuramoyl-L-alanine amidase [Psychroserpens sp.]
MIVLLDNGHGGVINTEYQTPGKRFDWGNEGIIYEGEFNRAIVGGIIEALTKLKIPYVNLAPEYRDVRLETRVKRANKYPKSKCFYLSVHSNAGGGHGSEIFTSPGDTKSDKIATIFGQEYKSVFPDRKLREDWSDGDLDKERRFYVLTKTKMPAILTESFFMDNFEEFKTILNTREGRQQIVDYHVNAILRTKNEIFS